MIRWLVRLFDLLPIFVRGPLKKVLKPAAVLLQHGTTFLQDLRVPVYEIARDEKRLFIIGDRTTLWYIIKLMYGEILEPVFLRKIFFWRIGCEFERLQAAADFVAVHLSPALCPKSLGEKSFSLPFLITQLCDLPPGDEPIEKIFRKYSVRSDLRQIRKYGYTYRITDDPETFKHYYESFYRPYILSRHGGIAYLHDFQEIKRVFESGQLMMISREGREVSGGINSVWGKTFRMDSVGLLNADPQLIREGAMTAEYYFAFQEARRHGCTRVDMGAAEPFLNDGVLQYKKKWGAWVEPRKPQFRRLLLHVCQLKPSVSRFLEENPFLAFNGRGLASVVFLGDHVEWDHKDLDSYFRRIDFEGVPTQYVFLLSDSWSRRKDEFKALEDRIQARMVILDLADGKAPNAERLGSLVKENIRGDE